MENLLAQLAGIDGEQQRLGDGDTTGRVMGVAEHLAQPERLLVLHDFNDPAGTAGYIDHALDAPAEQNIGLADRLPGLVKGLIGRQFDDAAGGGKPGEQRRRQAPQQQAGREQFALGAIRIVKPGIQSGGPCM
ncbi:hypothetical protein SDC9_181031 [bioreactor metagenome]|uniref:Uncharacterized protein n=1 Tax=bioreactor metagenome TaxID=1076179 RepID=A0A645HCM8_9ZZZZ